MSEPKPETEPGLVILRDRPPDGPPRWLQFSAPLEVIEARFLEEVPDAIEAVEQAVAQGRHAAGFLTYEAATAFEPACRTKPPGDIPLVWFGIYENPEEINLTPPAGRNGTGQTWEPTLTRTDYRETVGKVKAHIAAGDTYQVNLTFRLRAPFSGDPLQRFQQLVPLGTESYSAYLDAGRHLICSTSPELFFRLDGSHIRCRPMKGTAPRGRFVEEDDAQERWLRHSAKNRAENVMIVDMIRNDLGRIARTGTVQVESLFDVERYPTLFQMTSGVRADTDATFSEILAALFPCASITGAPKIKTMEIIAELEPERRGVYTGCIGYLAPDRRAQFNVAIRTLCIDRVTQTAEFGTGGGIVWDSEPESEFEECRTKALVIESQPPPFDLLEALLWTPEKGFDLLENHLNRLDRSARYFGFPSDIRITRERLAAFSQTFPNAPQKVRLLLSSDGRIDLETATIERMDRPRRVALALAPVDHRNPFLYHKTTNRDLYERALAACSEADDVILWNKEQELTESCRANLVLKIGGQWWTPPVTSGLLVGTFREELLRNGEIREKRLRLADLDLADEVCLINSVRHWMPITWLKGEETEGDDSN